MGARKIIASTVNKRRNSEDITSKDIERLAIVEERDPSFFPVLSMEYSTGKDKQNLRR